MKKIQFFLVAAVAIMFAACSNDDVVLTDAGSVAGSSYEGGDGYVAVSITMPDQTSTRATRADEKNNGSFVAGDDTGEYNEYEVNDATLLLFHANSGTGEDGAKFYAAYPLYVGSLTDNNNNNNNIEKYVSVVRKIDMPTANNQDLYALVVLNKGNLLVLNGEGTLDSGELVSITFNGDPLNSDTTIGDLQGNKVSQTTYTYALTGKTDASDFYNHGFFMTNAPLYAAPGGNDDPTDPADGYESKVLTLAPINMDKIHSSEEDATAAKDDPALIVYVERAVAKVTVVEKSGGATNTIDDSAVEGNLQGVDFDVNGYKLDVTNKSSYFVRNTTTDSGENDYSMSWWGMKSLYKGTTYDATIADYAPYRFVGDDKVGKNAGTSMGDNGATLTGANSLYRTYWAEDPNYRDKTNIAASTASTYFNVYQDSYIADEDLESIGDVDYCLENTFNLACQLQSQTTRLIVQGQFKLDSNNDVDLYTIDDDDRTVYPLTTDTYTVNSTSTSFEGIKEFILREYILENDNIMEYEDYYKPDTGKSFTDYFTVTIETSAVPSEDLNFSVTWDDNNAGTWGQKDGVNVQTSDLTSVINTEVGSNAVYDSNGVTLKTPASGLNAKHAILYYPAGKCYYPVRIQHFGNDSTPWDTADLEAKSQYGTATSVYPEGGLGASGETEYGDWLGRYGVLRNNWYEISINSVTGLGTPVVPELTNKEDDEIHTYIDCTFTMLSWRSHTQSSVLK